MASLGIFMHSIMSSANSEFSFFLSNLNSFYFLLLWLAQLFFMLTSQPFPEFVSVVQTIFVPFLSIYAFLNISMQVILNFGFILASWESLNVYICVSPQILFNCLRYSCSMRSDFKSLQLVLTVTKDEKYWSVTYFDERWLVWLDSL